MINRETIDKIMETARIEEVVGDFVHLKKRGTSLIGNCPFHGEKTPSFHVSVTKGIYKCFGCGKGGDSVRFIMEHEKYWHEGMAYQEKELFMSFLSLKLEQRKIIRDIISSYSELNEMKGAKEIKPKDSVVKVNKISQIKPS